MSSEIGTIVVLAGGLSHERDVSLRSGRRVAQALRDRGHDVVESDVTAGLADLLTTTPDPVVFPVLHGSDGEDGALRTVKEVKTIAADGTGVAKFRIPTGAALGTHQVSVSGVQSLPVRSTVVVRR